MVKETHWYNVYGKSWGALCVKEISTHPAKFSRALIYRIVEHMVAQGYVKPGDTVLDPFGGIALGAIPLIQRGINWSGMELEEHFVALGNANIEKWNREFGVHCARWGRASLVRGDSRYLLPLLGRARAVMASPPYAQSLHQRGHGIDKDKFTRKRDRGRDVPAIDAVGAGYGAVVSSPPYSDSVNSAGHGIDFSKAKPDYPGRKMHDDRLEQLDENHDERRYGSGTGQLGAMSGGDFDAIVGSPPYADRIGGDDPKKRGGIFNDPDRANDAQMTARYGDADGQLGAMKDTGFDASMGSPPYGRSLMPDMNDPEKYAASEARYAESRPDRIKGAAMIYGSGDGQVGNMRDDDFDATVSSPPYGGSDMRGGNTEMTREKNTPSAGYGKSKGQLGGKDGATFWSASRLITESCYDVLRPGGVAVWVVKNYCRAMEIVPFCQRWLDLQLACGFQHVETIVAHQTDNPGLVQRGLFGEDESLEKRRAGLFRILYESKGGPVVDSEMVYILKKPLDIMAHS